MDRIQRCFGRHRLQEDDDGVRRVESSPTVRSSETSSFVLNRISNTKYTLLTFLPLNLREQFSQSMNKYFLLIAILQLFPEITPVNPITTWGPLLIIFTISAIKEANDDIKRYKSDKEANERKVRVLNTQNQLVEQQAQTIKVGDIIYLEKDDEIPADCVCIKTSEQDGSGYIETANLDGETNLKLRVAPVQLHHLTRKQLSTLQATIDCSTPNKNIYNFDSTLHMKNDQGHAETIPLTSDFLFLQATYLRNTAWAYGLVVYTGNETKVGQNKTIPRLKRTKLDNMINWTTKIVFLLQLILIATWGAFGVAHSNKDKDHHWYLHLATAHKRWFDPFIIPLRFLLLASMMIPISLKVSLDMIKLYYSLVIGWDVEMYDAKRDIPTHVSNTSIAEDLGQISYVLSDKTGTLTQNEMIFKRFATSNVSWGNQSSDDEEDNQEMMKEREAQRKQELKAFVKQQETSVTLLLRHMSICNTVVPSMHEPDLADDTVQTDETAASHEVAPILTTPVSDTKLSTIAFATSSPDEFCLVNFAHEHHVSLVSRQGGVACVQVGRIPEDENATDASSRSNSSSSSGSGSTISGSLDVPAHIEQYEVLSVLEFNSTRKRMSVIFRDTQGYIQYENEQAEYKQTDSSSSSSSSKGRIWLFCKGADDVIYARLNSVSSNSPSAASFRAQLNEYASRGLRTLCYSLRPISEEEYATWKEKFDIANTTILHREDKLAQVYEEIEKDMSVIGVTGIEDKLQERVSETIYTLREANIKVWMLTGDKYETAVQISRACNLITPADKMFTIRAKSKQECIDAIDSILEQTQQLNAQQDEQHSHSHAHNHDHNHDQHQQTSNPFLPTPPSLSINHNEGEAELLHTRSQKKSFCLVIDGVSLGYCLSNFENSFSQLAKDATSVVCCRVTPAQKAQVVKMVKETTGKTTLAIGDGGNDVSMIVEADVGVGISGHEGLQAARAADFSFSRFYYLQKLLLVHGRYSHNRSAWIAQYCFYRSMLICLVQLFFAVESEFSGASYFDSYSLMTYNIFYASLPAFLYLFEKDVSQNLLLHNPKLYITTQLATNYTGKTVAVWILRALFQSVFLILFAVNSTDSWLATRLGTSTEQLSEALTIYTVIVLIHPVTLYLECGSWNWIHHVVLGGTVLTFMIINCVLAAIPFMDLYGIYLTLLHSPVYYLRVLVLLVICIIPLFIYKYWEDQYDNSLVASAHREDLRIKQLQDAKLGLGARDDNATRARKSRLSTHNYAMLDYIDPPSSIRRHDSSEPSSLVDASPMTSSPESSSQSSSLLSSNATPPGSRPPSYLRMSYQLPPSELYRQAEMERTLEHHQNSLVTISENENHNKSDEFNAVSLSQAVPNSGESNTTTITTTLDIINLDSLPLTTTPDADINTSGRNTSSNHAYNSHTETSYQNQSDLFDHLSNSNSNLTTTSTSQHSSSHHHHPVHPPTYQTAHSSSPELDLVSLSLAPQHIKHDDPQTTQASDELSFNIMR